MKKQLRRLTETALMLALLLTLQTVTKTLGQLVTGSCVNAVLTVTVLLVGLPGGLAVAILSPAAAWLLGIAPQVLTVPVIMVGNAVYVGLLFRLARGGTLRMALGWVAAAAAKFAVLYLLVAKVLCGILAKPLLAAGTLKQPMLTALPAMFGWMQLVTALIGGAVGLALVSVLKKALHR